MTPKRCVDIAGSALGLCLLSPLMLAVAALVRLHDGGPVLFRQRRVGLRGVPFTLLKFRTMRVDAPRLGGSITVGRDNRITPLGYWLRRLKLDELPQLLNVLCGQMSLVGPRPEVPEFVALYSPQQRQVLDFKPGLTDPASIHYRNESEILAGTDDPHRTYVETIMPHKIQRSLQYARRATVWSDLQTMTQTLRVVASPNSAAAAQPCDLHPAPLDINSRDDSRQDPAAIAVAVPRRTAKVRHGRPTICFVSAEHPAEDKRVFQKEAVSLARAGFRVLHLCPDAGPGRRTVQGVELVTYPRRRGRLRRLLMLGRLFRQARALGADAYHCNEPDSWVVGVLLRFWHRELVVFDCHEHYPGQVARWLPWIVRRPGVWATRYVLQMLGLLTDLIVLAKYSVAGDFSWSRRHQLVVLNTTPLAALHKTPAGRTIAGRTTAGRATAAVSADNQQSDPFTFVHIGVIRRERGSEQLLSAMTELNRRGASDYRVVIIGEFKDGSEQDFFAKADALRLRQQIEFHPWMPFDEAFALVSRSHAGLILFQKTLANNVCGMPHKMFDYMLAALPVIAPDFAPDIVGVIREAGAGLLVDTADPVKLADAMQSLMADRQFARRLGEQGRAAVAARFNWEYDARNLIAAYCHMLRVGPSAGAPALREAA